MVTARSLLSCLPLALLAGCAGYAEDYWKPKESLLAAQLPRYGLDAVQAQCVNGRLKQSLTVWQLRQLADLASRLTPGGKNPSVLSAWDLRYIAGLVKDPKVGMEVASALDTCGLLLTLAAAPPPPADPPSAAAAPQPLRWVDLGAAETGQSIAVDITSVATTGQRREGWFRLTNPGEAPQPVAYRLRVDCQARTITPTAARRYGAEGAVAEQRDYGSGGEGPLPVEPGTVMEIAWTRVCS